MRCICMVSNRMLKTGDGVAGTIPLLAQRAHSRIDQATLEIEVGNWEHARSWDHPTHPFKVTARCGLAWDKARLGALGLGG